MRVSFLLFLIAGAEAAHWFRSASAGHVKEKGRSASGPLSNVSQASREAAEGRRVSVEVISRAALTGQRPAWAFRFEPDSLDRGLRFLFDPNRQASAFMIEGNSQLRTNPEDWRPIARGPFAVAVHGIEFWEKNPKEFARMMMAWMAALTSRPSKFIEVLKEVQSLLSPKHRESFLFTGEIGEDMNRLANAIEEADTNVNNVNTIMSVPAFAQTFTLNPDGVAVLDSMTAAADALGNAFTGLAAGFFLLRAVFLDKKLVEKGYSIAQAGTVVADVFIHAALAGATLGASAPFSSAAGLYTGVRSLVDYIRDNEALRRRFMRNEEIIEEELQKIEQRRTEICFVTFYAAVSVAEMSARLIHDMTLKRDQDAADLLDSGDVEAALEIQREIRQMYEFGLAVDTRIQERMADMSVLFSDLLDALIPNSEGVHNIPEHLSAKVPLRLCGGHEVKLLSKEGWTFIPKWPNSYITPLSMKWSTGLMRLRTSDYEQCRLDYRVAFAGMLKSMPEDRHNKAFGKHWRMPCSPSEFVMAFYYNVRKQQGAKWPLTRRAFTFIDKLLFAFASPTATILSATRTSILNYMEGKRSMERKLFSDQDLGVMQVWFTLNIFHLVSFSRFDTDDCFREGMLVPYVTYRDTFNKLFDGAILKASDEDEVPEAIVEEDAEYQLKYGREIMALDKDISVFMWAFRSKQSSGGGDALGAKNTIHHITRSRSAPSPRKQLHAPLLTSHEIYEDYFDSGPRPADPKCIARPSEDEQAANAWDMVFAKVWTANLQVRGVTEAEKVTEFMNSVRDI